MKMRNACTALAGAAALLLGATLSLGAEMGLDGLAGSGAFAGKLIQRAPRTGPPAPTASTGWVQYGIHCAGCHGATMRGRSAAAIQEAISRYFSMKGLSSMSPTQLNAIALGQ